MEDSRGGEGGEGSLRGFWVVWGSLGGSRGVCWTSIGHFLPLLYGTKFGSKHHIIVQLANVYKEVLLTHFWTETLFQEPQSGALGRGAFRGPSLEIQVVHTVNNTQHMIFHQVKSSFIRFIVLARNRRWPLDGAAPYEEREAKCPIPLSGTY